MGEATADQSSCLFFALISTRPVTATFSHFSKKESVKFGFQSMSLSQS